MLSLLSMNLTEKLKIIINKRGFNIHALPHDMKEALKTYQQYGKIWIWKKLIGEDGKRI